MPPTVITTLTELFRALACVSLELPEQGKCEIFPYGLLLISCR